MPKLKISVQKFLGTKILARGFSINVTNSFYLIKFLQTAVNKHSIWICDHHLPLTNIQSLSVFHCTWQVSW